MTDTNVHNTCQSFGMVTPCAGPAGCAYNDNICTLTSEIGCGNPMWTSAKARCGGTTYPSQCGSFDGTFAYMGHNWSESCGALNGSWCVGGGGVSNHFAFCARRQ
jgi:hypothetical protein